MDYEELVEAYSALEKTSKRLEKTFIIMQLLQKTQQDHLQEIISLLQGIVFPAWDERKLGMSSRLVIKTMRFATGISSEKIEGLWAKTGDLGLVAESLMKEKKQMTLATHHLTVKKVFSNLQTIATLEGEGTVNKKINVVAELLTSAKPLEARFIVRTVIGQLRIGVAAGILRDAISWAFFPKIVGIFAECEKCNAINPQTERCLSCHAPLAIKFSNEIQKTHQRVLHVDSLKDIEKLSFKQLESYSWILASDKRITRGIYTYFIDKVQELYDVTNDFSETVAVLKLHKKITKEIKIGVPINSMLAIAIDDIDEAFEALGKPILCEPKLDGFRLQIHKENEKICLFTRRLENVTTQFQELVPIIQKNVKADSFILDSEAVGYDPKSSKYLPFQAISQRIKRKYNINEIAKKIPVEINVFDILSKNKENLMMMTQEERRKMLEKVIHEVPRKIVLTKKLISEDKKEIDAFYKDLLKQGIEGIMLKNLKKAYAPGRKVGGWLKLKPTLEPLDLVIVAADYGDGKRAGWLTSYTLACRKDGKLVEIGKASTGLKEKSEGLSFHDMTKLLKPLIIEQKGKHVIVKPEIVVEVAYEEIQKSQNYASGWALRFPTIIRLREDRKALDCDDVKRVEQIYDTQRGKKRKIAKKS